MCTRPYIMLNPSAVSSVPFAEGALLNGVKFTRDDIRSMSLFAYAFNRDFVPSKSSFWHACGCECLNVDEKRYYDASTREKQDYLNAFLSNNYLILPNGKYINFYLACGCGHCEECCYQRKSQIEKRLLLEAADAGDMVFFTLTYDSKHLPLTDEGVATLCPSHVASALKRLRIQVDRYFETPLKFRVFYVGEYGKNSFRPHYHGLIFFDRTLSYVELARFREIFYYKRGSEFRKKFPRTHNFWPYGFKRDFQVCRNREASARYVSKYLVKQFIHVPLEGAAPSFYRGPRRCGGLGAFNLSSRADDLLSCLRECVPYRFLLGSKIVSIRVPNYIRAKLLPSLSRIAPKLSLAYNVMCVAVKHLERFSDTCPYWSNIYISHLNCCEYLSQQLAFLSLRTLFGGSSDIYKDFISKLEYYGVSNLFSIVDQCATYLFRYYDEIVTYRDQVLNILKNYSPFIDRLNLLLSLPQKSEQFASDVRYIQNHNKDAD